MRIVPVSGVGLRSSPAVEAFLFDFRKVAASYQYDWSKQHSFTQRAAYLNGGGYRGDRTAVAAVLLQYNQNLGAGPATLEQIRLLAQEGTLTVVTGQQPGIFTGPAYCIYKAITAIRLARRQSEALGVPVVPVFWVPGEDHDWVEVASVMAPAGEGVTRLSVKESFEGERRSVGLAPIPSSVQALVSEFITLLPETEFKAEVAGQVQAALEAAPALDPAVTWGKPTLADWFARLLTWLFQGTGLVLINSADPALRRLEAPFFGRAIQQHEQIDEALGQGRAQFERLGYQPTVERHLGSLNLFTYVQGERLPLMGAGEQFWIRGREEIGWSQDQLLQRAASEPELFSTNVVLRPVVQGFLLPDLAYVGGPGEISYFGLYQPVFAALNQQMPIVYPRESYTLVEPPLARILSKQGLELGEVFTQLEAKKQAVLDREDRLGIPVLFEQFRAEFGQRYGHLVEQVVTLDPSLAFVAEENRKQIAVQINRLEEKARHQHRKNCEVAMRQFDRVQSNLLPNGGLQERSLSFLPYVAKYGPDLVSRMLQETEWIPRWQHQAVYL